MDKIRDGMARREVTKLFFLSKRFDGRSDYLSDIPILS
ncbi:hypothetical protein NOC27_2449 [Nitrosococcus oceani AFC27]|nr:hypothetical protein NOC27_2449 [Nitrosococcus oceani AFC27]